MPLDKVLETALAQETCINVALTWRGRPLRDICSSSFCFLDRSFSLASHTQGIKSRYQVKFFRYRSFCCNHSNSIDHETNPAPQTKLHTTANMQSMREKLKRKLSMHDKNRKEPPPKPTHPSQTCFSISHRLH